MKQLIGDFDFELKEVSEQGHFEGYAATFRNLDLQGDICDAGCFANTIRETKGKWPIFTAHMMSRIVGFSTEASEDSKGLLVAGEFTLDSDEGKNAYATARHAVKVGHKLGLSIGYGVRENGAESDKNGIRHLKDVDVYEFSIAAVPANPRARIARVKSGEWTEKEFEQLLREAGHSREFAKRFVLGGYKAALEFQRDAGESDLESAFLLVAEMRQSELLFKMKGL